MTGLVRWLETAGRPVMDLMEVTGACVLLALRVVDRLVRKPWPWRQLGPQVAAIGTDSLPIALVTALSVGMVFTLQISNEFQRFGASSVIGGVAGIALVRELIPTLTGVVVAGRVGAAIAAELGAMQVTEQVDALTAMAADPVRILVAPRVLACLAVLPMLTMIADVVGLAGGFGVAVQLKGLAAVRFLDSLQGLVKLEDVLKGLLKAAWFGLVVGVIGSQRGLSATAGARGVGRATTEAVVYSLITIFVTNYLLSAWLFPGGAR